MKDSTNLSSDNSNEPASGAPADPVAAQHPKHPEESKYTWVLGALVWLIIIAAVFAPRLFNNDIQILLQVTPQDLLTINGVVLYEGTPVKSGYVRLTLDEPKTKRFLGSTIASITNQGSFLVSKDAHLSDGSTNKQFRITATFNGQGIGKNGKEASN